MPVVIYLDRRLSDYLAVRSCTRIFPKKLVIYAVSAKPWDGPILCTLQESYCIAVL
jgi:hypothetical protein